ncbi:Beta-xylosidase [subsurface metagenome]
MEMTSLTYKSLIRQVRDGTVLEQTIDEAVRRILRMKFKLGLFEHPYTDPELQNTEYLKNNHITLARKMARESMVLLKNENGVLPINENIKSIAVVGPYANSYDQLGWWSSLGHQKDVVTVTCGIRNRAKDKFQITDKIDEKTDLVILCVGEESRLFGENNCRSTLKLPHSQESFVDSIVKKGKPVVLIIFNGRPLDLTGVESRANAILIAWHPGIEGGNAVADILFGDYNPSGKLTTSFPRSIGQIPVYYNHRRSGRPQHNKYVDEKAEPLYPFGYGLSYTTFEYSNLKLSSDKIKASQSLEVSATIQNTGTVAGCEVVQLYIQDVSGSTSRPVKELKGFKKILLQPGEKKKVMFELGPTHLSMLDINMKWTVEPGKFYGWVGPDSKRGLVGTFEVVKE